MLTTYLKNPLTLERYRSEPAGPHLDAFLGWLEQRAKQGTGTARVRDVIGGSTQPAVTWP